MSVRISNITSYEVLRTATGVVTNIMHHYHNEYYASRYGDWMALPQVQEEEDRFLERRFKKPHSIGDHR